MNYIKTTLLLLLLGIIMPLSASADNEGKTIAEARTLTTGQSSCLFYKGETYESYRYFKYTATENGIINLAGPSIIGFVPMDASENQLPAITGNGMCKMPVRSGSTTYIAAYPNIQVLESDSLIAFETSFVKNENAGKGATPEDPIVIEDDVENIILNTTGGYAGFDSYFVYTAKANGVLNLKSSGYLNTKVYGTSFSSLDREFVSDYDAGNYVGRIPVTAGNTVYIKINTYGSATVVGSLTHPEQGTLDNPYDAVIGDNSVPGEFGNYYFLFSGAQENGYLSLKSEQKLPRGCVKVFNVGDLGTPVAQSESGSYSLRFAVVKNTPYILYVMKVEDSEDEDKKGNPLPDTFTMSFEPQAQGDTPQNPIKLTIGEATGASQYAGTYYYMVQIPELSEEKMLEVKAESTNAGVANISVYDVAEGAYWAVKGQGFVKMAVKSKHSYMVVLNKEQDGDCSLTATLRDVMAGETIGKPIVAVKGDNAMAKAESTYYSYTATLSGRMTITMHLPGITVEFPIGADPAQGMYIPEVMGTSYVLDVKAGTTYNLHFRNISENTNFTLDEHEYAAGEAMATAIPVTSGYISMPGGQASIWYKYTCAKEGKLEIKSEQGFIGDESTIIYCCTDANTSPYYLNTSNEDGDIIYSVTRDVKEGEVMYVHISTAGNFGNKHLNFNLRDYMTGESISKPYVMSSEANKIEGIPGASRNQYRWIKVDMKGVKSVEIASDRFVTGGIFENESNPGDYVATFVPDANNEVCTVAYENTKNLETIYVCIEMSGGIVTLTGTFAEATGIESVDKADAPASGTIYTLSGVRANMSYKGIVVKNGKKYVLR